MNFLVFSYSECSRDMAPKILKYLQITLPLTVANWALIMSITIVHFGSTHRKTVLQSVKSYYTTSVQADLRGLCYSIG